MALSSLPLLENVLTSLSCPLWFTSEDMRWVLEMWQVVCLLTTGASLKSLSFVVELRVGIPNNKMCK